MNYVSAIVICKKNQNIGIILNTKDHHEIGWFWFEIMWSDFRITWEDINTSKEDSWFKVLQ